MGQIAIEEQWKDDDPPKKGPGEPCTKTAWDAASTHCGWPDLKSMVTTTSLKRSKFCVGRLG
jgi:hypothetical protein